MSRKMLSWIKALNRRQFLFSLPTLGLTIPAYGHFIEPHWFEETRTRVYVPGLSRNIRVLHLSDLHISPFVPFSVIEEAISIGLRSRPDLICLTGDFITNDAPFDRDLYEACLKRLAQAAPCFACLGNHDGGSWTETVGGFSDTSVVRNLLAASQVTLLHNRAQVISVRGQKLQLVGLGDIWNDEADPGYAFANVNPRIPTVVLAHNPDTKDMIGAFPWHAMLSGHTHGGQVLVPVVGTRFVAVKDKRFVAGLREWNGRQVYVTRGVGSLGGIRLNCRPEVTLLELTGRPQPNRLI
jgi:predicted MPP superfamily phosphohydrolase